MPAKKKTKKIKRKDQIRQEEFWHRFKQSPFYQLASEIGLKLGIRDVQRSEEEFKGFIFISPEELIGTEGNEWIYYEKALRRATSLYEDFLPSKKPPSTHPPTPEVGLAELHKWCIESYFDLVDKKNNDHLVPLSEAEKDVWDELKGRILNSAELGKRLDRTPDSIREKIAGIRVTGRKIENRGNCGYYRPDAPPL